MLAGGLFTDSPCLAKATSASRVLHSLFWFSSCSAEKFYEEVFSAGQAVSFCVETAPEKVAPARMCTYIDQPDSAPLYQPGRGTHVSVLGNLSDTFGSEVFRQLVSDHRILR